MPLAHEIIRALTVAAGTYRAHRVGLRDAVTRCDDQAQLSSLTADALSVECRDTTLPRDLENRPTHPCNHCDNTDALTLR